MRYNKIARTIGVPVSIAKPTILVTGGAGYIGSHAVFALQNSGYPVIVLDNLSYGHPEIVQDILKVELIVGDTRDRPLLAQIFSSRNIGAVMHLQLLLRWENR
jgi:UDP-glucose 4-epimerase